MLGSLATERSLGQSDIDKFEFLDVTLSACEIDWTVVNGWQDSNMKSFAAVEIGISAQCKTST